MKNKGKIHPSPPPPLNDSLSVLNLLPSTILVLVSVLSSEDKEVLSYLITRGTDRETSSSSSSSSTSSKKKNKKKEKKKSDNKSIKNHKPPVFDCECFDCYTNYWFRWDSSPNRELIHEIIEAFENHQHHLSFSDSPNNKSKKGKKKEKPGRRVIDTKPEPMTRQVSSPGRLSEADVAEAKAKEEAKSQVVYPAATVQHKGLARKILPDLLGLFKSNFWRLWNPNAYVSMT